MQGLRRGFDETRWVVVDYATGGEEGGKNIQKAIDSLDASGGTVYIPEGVYNLTSPIQFANKDNIVIIGAGHSTLIKITNGSSAFRFGGTGSPVKRIKVRDIMFEGSNNGTHSSSYGVDIIEGRECEVSDCYFLNWGRYGIFWQTCTHGITSNNILENIYDQAIIFDNGANNNTCVGNIIRNCNGGVGIDINSNYNTITANTFVGTSTNNGHQGTKAAFAQGQYCNYNSWTSNTVQDAKGHGIFVNGSFCTVVGNTIFKVGLNTSGASHGIFLQGRRNVVNGNTIIMGSGQHGIMIQGQESIVTSNNIIGSPSAIGVGILVYRVSGATISDNIIDYFWNNHGISVQGVSGTTMAYAENCRVKGNYVINCKNNGIDISAATTTIVEGNTVMYCSGNGIRNYNSSDKNIYVSNTLLNNKVFNFSGAAINDVIANNITV